MSRKLPPHVLPSDSAAVRWRDALVSGVLLACGWVLFEFAAAPGVGVTVASVKFGWNDFLTAIWLRKRDPHRERSAACFWFFVASGLWKITVVAFLLTVIIGTVARQAGKPPRKFIGSSTLLTLSGLAALTVVPIVGAIRARQNGVRVWVNGSVHAFRRRDQWPVWPTGRNNVKGLMLAALILPILVTAALAKFRGPRMFSALLVECFFLWMLARSAIARSPEEAWGSEWDLGPDPEPEEAMMVVEADPDEEYRAPWARANA